MDSATLRSLLQQVATGEQSIDGALSRLRTLPFEGLQFAQLDHHRAFRWGFPEVIFSEGKTAEQVAQIMLKLAERYDRVLATRVSAEQHAATVSTFASWSSEVRVCPDVHYKANARCMWIDREAERAKYEGIVLAAAGTSDLPVLEEAAITLDLMGHKPHVIYDIGVAGIHRIIPHIQRLQEAAVVVVFAGMEGALASVVAGLTDAPVVAVPTSVGYGASFNGLAALLAMLNSCASGVAVVNIDNGYGAACMAAQINQRIQNAK